MSNIWWSLDEYTRLAIGVGLWVVLTMAVCYTLGKLEEQFYRARDKKQKRMRGEEK